MGHRLDKLLFTQICLILGVFTPWDSTAQVITPTTSYLDKPVYEVLEQFRKQGYPFAYSSNLVPDALLVLAEPVSTTPVDIIREILSPHGLELRQSDGIYLVIRSARGPPGDNSGSLLVIIRDQTSTLLDQPVVISANPGLRAADDLGSGVWQIGGIAAGRYNLEISTKGYVPADRTIDITAGEKATLQVKLLLAPISLEDLSVSASRYLIFSSSQFFVDQRAIENLPVIGNDPIRAIRRLPGIAAGGWSAQNHFRGGEENESAIFLNGLQLLDPFHVRDFHNTFSSIEARTISGVEAFTGGFPAEYGDRMSGILLLQSREPDKPRHLELGVSVFNTSLLTSGYSRSKKLDWLVSARRSNLSMILEKKKHGEPNYNDIFATLGINISPDTRLSFNALRANDSILIITENKLEDQEQSTSETRNTHAWIQLEKNWSAGLNMSAVLSNSTMSNDRQAFVNDIEQLVGFVEDDRDIDIHRLRVDFNYSLNDRHLLSWGAQASKETASFNYRNHAEYSGFYLAYPGVPESLDRNIQVSPSGYSYAAYISDRWQLSSNFTIDAGLRWDKQTYIEPQNDDQVSPRINLLYALNPRVDLRLTWGRYYQSQDIQQLQVEDGVDHYFPAQQSDHLIAGMSVRFGNSWSLRAEAFQKNYSKLRPRFENLLDPVPLINELAPDRIRLSPSAGRARGAEFTLEYDGGEHLNWWVSYTLSRVHDRINGNDELRNWDQKHAFQAGLAWQRKSWEYGFAAKIHSGWPTTLATLEGDDEDELILVLAARNRARLNTFASIDFKVARKWQLEKSQVTAFFELSNTLNRKNECCVDYDIIDEDDEVPSLERSIDSWLGFVPAIGVLWEF